MEEWPGLIQRVGRERFAPGKFEPADASPACLKDKRTL